MGRNCLRVPRSRGEETRKKLAEEGILDNGFHIENDYEFIYLPLVNGAMVDDPRTVTRDLRPRNTGFRDYKELLSLPPELKELLPSSYDIIGEVAIIKIPHELEDYKLDIARALTVANRNIGKVAADKGVKGELRVRDLEPLIGGDDLETVHVENNVRLKMNPAEVYYSPRLATERMRLASMVGEERVLDMFCGVGPFAITIARHSRAEHVFGIDINPSCIRYMNINISLNGLDDRVEGILGDSAAVTPTIDDLDRIVMNLPHSALDYLEPAITSLRDGYIHLYSIIDEGDIMDTVRRIYEKAKELEKEAIIVGTREVHTYSPGSHMMALDIKVS